MAKLITSIRNLIGSIQKNKKTITIKVLKEFNYEKNYFFIFPYFFLYCY